jgi:hypothetical protein
MIVDDDVDISSDAHWHLFCSDRCYRSCPTSYRTNDYRDPAVN